jgi:hypothetical protein
MHIHGGAFIIANCTSSAIVTLLLLTNNTKKNKETVAPAHSSYMKKDEDKLQRHSHHERVQCTRLNLKKP